MNEQEVSSVDVQGRTEMVNKLMPRPGETIKNPACWKCGRPMASQLTAPYSLRCSRDKCKATNNSWWRPDGEDNS